MTIDRALPSGPSALAVGTSGLLESAPDEALLSQVAAGDLGAFAELFGRYAPRIKAWAMRGGLPADRAEDLAQEVMVALWRHAAGFDPARAGAATWIFAIARNRRIDLARRDRRPVPDPDDPLMQPDPVPDADARLTGAEREQAVRSALAALGDDQRAVVRLAFFVGLSHAQVAAELGLPLGTVKSRLRLAFQHLRAALGPEFDLTPGGD